MIERVTIQGFKSILDAEISLGRLNVLVGANGSGKSNVLEAIGLLGCAVSGKIGEEQFKHRGVRPGAPALYKSSFKNHKLRRLITLTAERGDLQYRAALDNPIDNPQRFWRFNNESYAEGKTEHGTRGPRGATLKRGDGEREQGAEPEGTQGIIPLLRTLRPDLPGADFLDALEDYAIFTPFTPMLRGLAADPAPRVPLGLSGGGLAAALKDLARHEQLYEQLHSGVMELVDWAADVRVSREEGPSGRALYFEDLHMRERRNVLSAADASEGALYVLFVLLLLLHSSSPRMFAIDNIDSALHPRLARTLVDRIQSLLLGDDVDHQMIVTTHNPLVLDALRLSDPRVRLLVVSRQSGTGMTVIRRIEHSEALARAVERGRTLSQLWVEGTLGGVPDLV